MESDRFTIDLLGTSFSIRSDKDAESLSRIVSHYSELTEQIQANTLLKDPLKIAILAGILAVDERDASDSESKTQMRIHQAEEAKAQELTSRMLRLLSNLQ